MVSKNEGTDEPTEVVSWQDVRDKISVSSDEELMEIWSQHYTDPSEKETPIMLTMVLCHNKMIEMRTLPYDQVEMVVDMHRKVQFPGWIVGVDLLTGEVVFRNANL